MFLKLLGVLLLNESLLEFGVDGREREVCNDRDWSHNGGDDVGVDTSDGQNGSEDAASVRVGGDVHLFDIHHDLVSHKGLYLGPESL